MSQGMVLFRLLAGVVAAGALAAPGVAEIRGPLPRPSPAGEVCGEPALLGTPEPVIAGEGGCGVAAPVRLSSAAGVALEPPAVMACETARALAAWMEAGPSPVFAEAGERLEAVTVVDAYSCRNRNRAEAGKLSEHALGHAVDIGGFRLEGGAVVMVREGWELGRARFGAAPYPRRGLRAVRHGARPRGELRSTPTICTSTWRRGRSGTVVAQ